MKVLSTLIMASVAIVSFSSCQKDVDEKLPDLVPRPKTMKEEHSRPGGTKTTDTYNLTWDANGRMTSMAKVDDPTTREDYHYNSKSFTVDLYISNVLSIHEDFFLNNDGYIDSTYQYNDTQDTSTEKYTYNAAKQLAEIREYEYDFSRITPSDVRKFTYDSNGNLLNETSNQDGPITYEYYADLESPRWFGSTFYSFVPKNLVKSENDNGYMIQYTYTFDNEKRLTSETLTGDDGEILIRSYTY